MSRTSPAPGKKKIKERPTLLRTLTVTDGVAILVGITIGAGIYSTPQIIAGYLGSFSSILFLWVIVGAFVFLSGLVYAELGTRIPSTGGEYVYLHRCFGPFAGFMFGWSQLFIIRTSPAAALALVSADYMGYFVQMSPIARTLAAAGIILILGLVNYIGVRSASLYQKISTSLKVGGLFALIIIGLILLQGQESLLTGKVPPPGDFHPFRNIAAALMLILFTHTGWERLGYVAGEMKDPRRVIPKSLIIGILILVGSYVLINTVYHWTLGMEGMRESSIVASDTAVRLMGPVGASFVALLVIISATGSINGTIMASTRVYYAMARDGLFFRWLDHIHPRFRTPGRAIIVHCAWAIVILFFRGSFETIAAGMVFALLIFYSASAMALFKLRRRGEGRQDAYHVPFYPFLPGIYLAGCLALLAARLIFEWQNSLVDLAFVATGLPFSLIWLRRRKTSSQLG